MKGDIRAGAGLGRRGLAARAGAGALRAGVPATPRVTPEALPELTEADLRELGLPLGPRKLVLQGHPATWPRGTMLPLEAADPDGPASRAAAAHGDVRRPGRLDRALDPPRSRGPARGHPRLPGRRSRRGRAPRGASSPSTWATACSPISATPGRTRTTPSARSGPGWHRCEAVGRLAAPDGEPLAARVGIATGLVVVGDLLGRAPRRSEAVVGETPEPGRPAARRWPSRAASSSPKPRAGSSAACSSAPISAPRRLKGFAEPVRAYRVLGDERGREPVRGVPRRRPDAAGRARGGAGACCCGAGSRPRAARARWCCSRASRGSASRGCWRRCGAARRRAARPPALLLLAAPPGQPPAPGRSPSSSARPDSRAATRPSGSSRSWRRCWRRPRRRARSGRSWPSCCRSRPASATAARPDQPAAAQASAPSRRCCASSRGWRGASPVLMLFEDVHWIDPSSRELLDLVVDARPGLPVLLLVTFRPEFRPAWTGQPHVTALALSRLGRRESAALVRAGRGREGAPARAGGPDRRARRTACRCSSRS